MKLSISWILDHITGKRPILDDKFAQLVVDKFNSSVAEVDACQKVSVNLDQFTIAQVVDGNFVSAELDQQFGSGQRLAESGFYLLKKNDGDWERASLVDIGSYKDGLVPAIDISKELATGSWKKDFEAEDYILEIDNKSINHRPDLWGHRGFARELAALFDLQLADLEGFLEKSSFEKADTRADVDGFEVVNEASPKCRRFSAMDIPEITNKASDLKIATRLARVDNRPIDMLVDITNYVMWDIGQPMHAFDADKFPSKKIVIRFAKPNEKLKLLDGAELELTEDDLVIADKDRAISLAGIMGGESSGVSPETKALFLESANFDAVTIRRSAEKAKIRTEASSRFEKGLDPNQNVYAIERYTKLLKDLYVPFKAAEKIISLGAEARENQIDVGHKFIEAQLGVPLQQDFVIDTLGSIGFQAKAVGENYSVIVPTFRQGVSIPEDLVEEVGRLYGFEKIPHILPERASSSTEHVNLNRLRDIKKYLAFASDMMEVCNYPLFDEQFLQEINWQPKDAVELSNPVSENWQKLATSLVPLLLKNVFQNLKKADNLRFFEVAKAWRLVDGKPDEHNMLAGLFYSEKSIDFYSCKSELERLFEMLDIQVDWKKSPSVESWYALGQTADLFVENKKIGLAGNLDNQFLKKSFGGSGFAFELDLGAVLNSKIVESKFKAVPKYQSTWLDISMMIPKTVAVSKIESAVQKSDNRIYKIELIDIFEKPEWGDKKSVAVRFHFVDNNKTLTKEEIDAVLQEANKSVQALGAEVR